MNLKIVRGLVQGVVWKKEKEGEKYIIILSQKIKK